MALIATLQGLCCVAALLLLGELSYPKGLVWLTGTVAALALFASGMHARRYRGRLRDSALRIALAYSASAALFAATASTVAGNVPIVSSLVALLAGFLAAVTVSVLLRRAVERFVDQPIRTVVLGAGARASTLQTRLRRHADWKGFTLVGYMPQRSDLGCLPGGPSTRRLPPEPLPSLCERERIDCLVVACDDAEWPNEQQLRRSLGGVAVFSLERFFEHEFDLLLLDTPAPRRHSIPCSGESRYRSVHDALTRASDVLIGCVLLALTWPLMFLAGLAIRMEDGAGAPLVYRQTRVGLNDRPFELLKMRSMRIDAERDAGPRWATVDDPRVTRVGRFIRRTRIDELPQLLNVVRGDMSLVGPRPERPAFVAQLERDVPFYAERHSVRPGLTGWAQVNYPYGASLHDALRKHEYDLYYIKNRGIRLDLRTLCKTLEVVALCRGSR